MVYTTRLILASCELIRIKYIIYRDFFMASKEEKERLLDDMETSSEISTAAISSVLEENHNVTDSGTSRYTNRSASQGFVPVEVSKFYLLCNNNIIKTAGDISNT